MKSIKDFAFFIFFKTFFHILFFYFLNYFFILHYFLLILVLILYIKDGIRDFNKKKKKII